MIDLRPSFDEVPPPREVYRLALRVVRQAIQDSMIDPSRRKDEVRRREAVEARESALRFLQSDPLVLDVLRAAGVHGQTFDAWASMDLPQRRTTFAIADRRIWSLSSFSVRGNGRQAP